MFPLITLILPDGTFLATQYSEDNIALYLISDSGAPIFSTEIIISQDSQRWEEVNRELEARRESQDEGKEADLFVSLDSVPLEEGIFLTLASVSSSNGKILLHNCLVSVGFSSEGEEEIFLTSNFEVVKFLSFLDSFISGDLFADINDLFTMTENIVCGVYKQGESFFLAQMDRDEILVNFSKVQAIFVKNYILSLNIDI